MNICYITAIFVLLSAAASATSTLRLMTYNIHSGFPMGTNSKNYVVTEGDLKNIADVITSSAPHIAAIQEVQSVWGLASQTTHSTSYISEPRMLSAFTKMHYAFGSAIEDHDYPTTNQKYLEWGEADHWQNNGKRHGEYGNVVLSSLGFNANPETYPLPALPEKEPRQFLRVQTELPGSQKQIIFYATHFAHDSASSRVDQMHTLLKRAAKESSEAIVFIAGDLNFVPGSPGALLQMARKAGFHDLHAAYAEAKGSKPEPTVPPDKPDRRIDYILCNKPLRVTHAEVIPTLMSDHLPLVVEVELE